MNYSGKLMQVAALTALVCTLGGCLERKLQITSEPAGALCWVNDREVGVTPLELEFTFYGTYEVRLKKEGFEPLVTKARARQPVYEYPPLDLMATVVPVKIENTVKWHFVMEQSKELTQPKDEFETDLLKRAMELRGNAVGEPAKEASPKQEAPKVEPK